MPHEFKYNDHIEYDWKLMFIGTDEGYVSAVYPGGIDDEFKFQYVYNHTDHLGNIRQNITRENGRLTVLREHNYYPFGLLHRGYNEDKEDLKYDKEQDFIFTVQAQAGRYKYKFQGQERQEDLQLGWDSFKYRNYDYAIGRFFNVDPLAEKFPYNGVYNFSENRVVDGREFEGLEVVAVGKVNTQSLVVSGTTEAGFVGGRDGLYAYGSYGYGFETNASIFTGVSITIYPTMPTVKGFYEGDSYQGGVNGKLFGVSGGINGVYSNGYWGINVQVGEGASFFLFSVSGYKMHTTITDLTNGNAHRAMSYLQMAVNKIESEIKKVNTDIANCQQLINDYKLDNQVNALLLNSSNITEEQKQQYQAEIERNNNNIRALQQQISNLEETNNKLKQAQNVLQQTINQIKKDDKNNNQNN